MARERVNSVIESTYEIDHEIGSGGGGIVYLAKHLRLDKYVALKADKRELHKGHEELRREVDILKNLSHTYIPQVYDFIQEDGVVYTVEDYIPGKSLDKYLKEGKRFSQAQIITWACQLLEALSYLHSRPPYGILHGDLKPANVMLRADGNICLIDYNIALFLGEEGAVQVGSSIGYASPEHYGIDYSGVAETYIRKSAARTEYGLKRQSLYRNKNENQTAQTQYSRADEDDAARTEYGLKQQTTYTAQTQYSRADGDDAARTSYGTAGSDRSLNSTGSGEKSILIDARSDIYGLGATLYHLLTGNRPAREAAQVEPIRQPDVSKAVADLIQKAMEPNPDMRFQTAEEMLYAFRHLHDQDFRTRRHKRRVCICAVIFAMILLAGSAVTFIGLKQMERMQNMQVLAEYSSNALREGDTKQAVRLALDAMPKARGLFEVPALAEPQKALTDALGVYELDDEFGPHDLIQLPAEVFFMCMSPNGNRLAAAYAYEAAVFDLESGQMLVSRPIERSALSEIEFIDNDRMIFAGQEGLEVYDLSKNQTLWTGKPATGIAVSGDKQIAATVYKDESKCFLYRISTGEQIASVDFDGRKQYVDYNDIFANPKENLFELNQDGSLLAVSFRDGSLDVFCVEEPDESLSVLDEDSGCFRFSGGFFQKYFAFSAADSEKSEFFVIDTGKAVQTGGFTLSAKVTVSCDESGIYLCSDNFLERIDPESGREESVAYTMAEILNYERMDAFTAVSTSDHTYEVFTPDALKMQTFTCDFTPDFVCISDRYLCAGSMSRTDIQVRRLKEHSSAQVAAYDASYSHSEARVNPSSRTAMLYDEEGFCLYDYDGNVIKKETFENSEQMFDQQYIWDGAESYLEVTYYDGTVDCYSAGDGSFTGSRVIEKPDRSLYEEFFTDQYKITSDLNGAPGVFLKSSGEKVCELESDDYLTYVTQAGEFIVTEYTNAEGERYGLLLNRDCETIAVLPHLCDILGAQGDMDGRIVFVMDDGLGSLRQCDMYSLQELQELGEIYINK